MKKIKIKEIDLQLYLFRRLDMFNPMIYCLFIIISYHLIFYIGLLIILHLFFRQILINNLDFVSLPQGPSV